MHAPAPRCIPPPSNEIVAESKRARNPPEERQLKIDIPPALKMQIKREAVDADVPVKRYVQRILEARLPWEAMDKLEEKAKEEGLDTRQLLLRLLQQAGILDS